MGYVLLAGALITAGTAYYSSTQQKKAAEKQASAIEGGTREFELEELPDPKLLDYRRAQTNAIDIPFDNLEYASRLSRGINVYNYSEAMKYYQKIQPHFKQLQSQIGENALSFSKGEIPDDVGDEIQREAAERGIQGGYGYGSQGAQNGALANLNLRNLGLTSLELSKFGTQLGINVNQSAKALLPNLSSPTDFLLTPEQILKSEVANVAVQNDFTIKNNAIKNAEASQNTQLLNSLNQSVAQANYTGAVAEANGIAQAGSTVGGALMGNAGTINKGVFGGQTTTAAPTNDAATFARFNTATQGETGYQNAAGAYGKERRLY